MILTDRQNTQAVPLRMNAVIQTFLHDCSSIMLLRHSISKIRNTHIHTKGLMFPIQRNTFSSGLSIYFQIGHNNRSDFHFFCLSIPCPAQHGNNNNLRSSGNQMAKCLLFFLSFPCLDKNLTACKVRLFFFSSVMSE